MKFVRLARFLARRLVAPRVARPERHPPHFTIGAEADPYMRRWFLIRQNRVLNIYLHEIRRSDDDRALHDHPWPSLSLCLSGSMIEVTKRGRSFISLGDPVIRRAAFAHRLEIASGVSCWTIFVTGPRLRSWGFHCPKGWVHWRDFVAPDAPGRIGRGCGEMG
jgi:hypothetical protein